MYVLRAPESKRQYPRRFQVFLDFLKLSVLTVDEKAELFYQLVKQQGRNWLESELITFFTYQNSLGEKRLNYPSFTTDWTRNLSNTKSNCYLR